MTSFTLAKSYEIAERVIKLMHGFNLKPTPENYAVWHEYISETNPDLIKTVEILKTNNRTIDEETSKYLYNKFFTFEQEGEGFLKTAQKTDSVLSELKHSLTSYNNETNSYSEALEKVSIGLVKSNSSEELKKIVHNVAGSTKKIQDHNDILRTQLEKSQSEIENLKKNLEELKIEATTDGLTGLANRKFFNATLLKDMTESLEDGGTLSLMMIDIDHFKKFNDTHGHTVGDQVIKLVARTLGNFAKGKGLPARYGGEEFSIIMPNTKPKDAYELANQIRSAMASKEIKNKKTDTSLGKVTLSIGVAEFTPGENAESFINRADEALYEAKNAGRDQVKLAAA